MEWREHGSFLIFHLLEPGSPVPGPAPVGLSICGNGHHGRLWLAPCGVDSFTIKGTPVELQTFPVVVPQSPDWQEGELSYANESKLKKLLRWHLEDFLDRIGLLNWLRFLLKKIGRK